MALEARRGIPSNGHSPAPWHSSVWPARVQQDADGEGDRHRKRDELYGSERARVAEQMGG